MEISYEALEKEIMDAFGESGIMVLATSAGGHVTARSMSCIFNGLRIAFQTGETSTKMKQIRENPRVALCMKNIQIEGEAAVLGHPYEIPWFKEQYAKLHPGSFKAYTGLEEERVVEVEPSLITLWKYDRDGKPYVDQLNVAEKKACRDYAAIVGSKQDQQG